MRGRSASLVRVRESGSPVRVKETRERLSGERDTRRGEPELATAELLAQRQLGERRIRARREGAATVLEVAEEDRPARRLAVEEHGVGRDEARARGRFDDRDRLHLARGLGGRVLEAEGARGGLGPPQAPPPLCPPPPPPA